MSSLILLLPFGLGDHIICNGIVRAHCAQYQRVAIFAKPRNMKTVRFMYRDLENLTIIEGDKSFAKNFILSRMAINAPATVDPKYDQLKIIGFQYFDPDSGIPFEQQEYQLAGLDLEQKWRNFRVQRDLVAEQALFQRVAPKNDYAFLHEDRSRNYIIDKKLINKKLALFTPAPEFTANLFDYCTIIERAKEIHVIDSSFMFLVDALNYNNPEQKLYIHRYARENEEWKLPILKKNWTIITTDGYSRLRKRLNRSLFLFKQITNKIQKK